MVAFVFLVVAFLASHQVSAFPGGAQIRVSSKGLQYGASLGMQVLSRELKKVSIPDQGASKDIKIGDAQWSARGLHIKNVAIPSYTVRPVSGGKLRASVSGVSVDAGGSISGGVRMKGIRTCLPYPCGWKICKKCTTIRAPGITIRQGVTIRARSISFTLDFDVGISGGKPTVRAAGCNARLPNIDIDLSSKVLDVIYNAIAPVLKHFLTPIIQNAVCNEASKAINNELNNVFNTFPVTQNIDSHSRINYELKGVSGTNDYFDMILRGEFQSRPNPQSSKLAMTAFPPTSNSDKMVYIWISDFTANTFGQIYHDAGLFQFVFDVNSIGIPNEIHQMLNTGSLGAFFPDLATKYPNRPMQFRAASYKAPVFNFSPGNAEVNLFASANFDVVDTDGKPVPAFWLKLDIKATGSVSVSNGATKIHAKIDGFKFKVEVGGYTLGEYNLPLDDPMIQGVVQSIIQMANPMLAQGFPLPTVNGLKLKNEKVTFVQNAVRVEGDVSYAL